MRNYEFFEPPAKDGAQFSASAAIPRDPSLDPIKRGPNAGSTRRTIRGDLVRLMRYEVVFDMENGDRVHVSIHWFTGKSIVALRAAMLRLKAVETVRPPQN